jgi:hypothetical protein
MRRRSNRTPEKRAKLLEVIRAGGSYVAAARAAGMSRRSVFDWKAADPAFKREIEDCVEEGSDRIVDAAWQRALLPDPRHDALLIFLLKCRDPERFNRKMLDATVGSDPNRPLVVNHMIEQRPQVVVVLPDNNRPVMTPEEIEAERAHLARENLLDVDPDEV